MRMELVDAAEKGRPGPTSGREHTLLGKQTMKRMTASFLTLIALALLVTASSAAGGHSKDIVDTAISAGSFKTLTAALQAGGLVEALRGDGPFTVFAPSDEAFAKLPQGTVEMLLKPENKDKLVDILTYHVIQGSVASNQVQGGSMAAALNGQKLRFSTQGGGVRVNDAQVVQADIECSNGMIHVIDSVILPSQ